MVIALVPVWDQIHDHLLMPVVTSPLPDKVCDLWNPGSHSWNHQLLTSTFSDEAVNIFQATPVVTSDHDDILRWTPAKNGQCSTKSVYTHLANQQVHHLPDQGSRSISQDAANILHKVWKSKSIPPLLKTFAWRLIRRAIATGERASRYSNHIDKHCSYCGAIEDDQHLFFKCALSMEVWSSADPPVQTNNFPPEIDGIQMSLSLMTTPNPSDDILSKTLFTLWYIWKARNDNRFNRRTWTSTQIHQRAKAHMHTYLEALQEKETPAVIRQPRNDDNLSAPSTYNSGTSNSNAGSSRGEALGEATSDVQSDRLLILLITFNSARISMLHRCFHAA